MTGSSGPDRPATRSRVAGLGRRAGPLIGAAVAAFVAGEAASRLDDRLFTDTSLFSSPVRDIDLMTQEAWGTRGRENGSYRRWKLNSFGFLGREITLAPTGRRVMTLGASETFGLYESRDKSYPAQLAALLGQRPELGDVEVVNAAVAGMALPAMRVYWENWASRFRPGTVLIYPSTHFYLDTDAPTPPVLRDAAPERPRPGVRSRFAERLTDQVRTIGVLRRIRARLMLSRALDGQGPDFVFKQPPADRIAAYTADLEQLALAIERRGARPVLVTHAFRTPRTLSSADRAELEYFRIFVPRALPEVMPAFVADAREATIALARKHGWALIDAAAELSGRRELYADPVHFTDEGSRRMAGIIAAALPGLLPAAGGSARTGGR